MFNIITGINESKTLRKHVNVNLIKETVIQINEGITINVDVSVKNIKYVKKIIFGKFVFVKMKSI